MSKHYTTIFLAIFIITGYVSAQTPAYGNINIFTREAYTSSLGYFSGSFQLPDFLDRERITFNGMNFTHQYDISNLGNIALNDDTELRFMLEGLFKIGAAIGETSIPSGEGYYPNRDIKYYLANVDFFTLSISPELTFVLDDGYAVCLYLGVDIFNAGGSIAILDQGSIDKHTVGVINLIPLTFRPAVFFDFGRSGVGIGAQINAVNILDYRISMSHLYPDERGFYSFDSFFRKFEFQLIFTF